MECDYWKTEAPGRLHRNTTALPACIVWIVGGVWLQLDVTFDVNDEDKIRTTETETATTTTTTSTY